MYRVRQANFLFHMAFHIKKRKLACRTLYYQYEVLASVSSTKLSGRLSLCDIGTEAQKTPAQTFPP
jgi:hypothetical protein